MKSDEIIYNYLIEPFNKNRNRKFGAELEFSLFPQRDTLYKADISAWKSILSSPEINGKPTETSLDGYVIKCRLPDNNSISFDSSYLNLEYSLEPEDSLESLYDHFLHLQNIMAPIITRHDLLFTESGFNRPLFESSTDARILWKNDVICRHLYYGCGINSTVAGISNPDYNFFQYISSVQTHHNASIDELPDKMNFLSMMDFLEILLFSNSDGVVNRNSLRDLRCLIYRESPFGKLGMAGTIGKTFTDIDSIITYYQELNVCWKENEKVEVFSPVKVKDYFDSGKYDSSEKDVIGWYWCHNAELTPQGTIEYRIVDEQRSGYEFIPIVFNSCLMRNYKQASEIIKRWKKDRRVEQSYADLADLAIYRQYDALFTGTFKIGMLMNELLSAAVENCSDFEMSMLVRLEPIIKKWSRF